MANCSEMLAAWQSRRQMMGTAQALIVTHSQPAAKDYRERIKQVYPAPACGWGLRRTWMHRTLNGFRKGQGDILITVGMAYVGFDAPCISHVALLTYIRQRAWIEQAISRGARVDPHHPYEMQRCVVFAPNDPLLRSIVGEIEAEQEEALAEDGPPGPPRPPLERQQTVVLDVALTDTQAHELNTVSLTPELSERYARALAQQGISATPVQMFHAFRNAHGADPMPYASTAPAMGIRDQEELLKGRIEERCRATDGRRGVPFGTTNGDMIRHFKLSRTQMSLEQLALAPVGWIAIIRSRPSHHARSAHDVTRHRPFRAALGTRITRMDHHASLAVGRVPVRHQEQPDDRTRSL